MVLLTTAGFTKFPLFLLCARQRVYPENTPAGAEQPSGPSVPAKVCRMYR